MYTYVDIYFTIILITVLFSAIIIEIMGVHAFFCAFIIGLIISDLEFDKEGMFKKIHDISIILFMPIFFALSGLRTSIGLLNTEYLWSIFFIILLIAVVGKLLSSTLASKVSGLNWYDSISVGILMNTRGLIELIILNIGYDLGIIQPTLFTIMVLMAIATTFMTGSLLQIVEKLKPKNEIISNL